MSINSISTRVFRIPYENMKRVVIILSLATLAFGYDLEASRSVMDIQVRKQLERVPRLIEDAIEATNEMRRKEARKNKGYGWSIISGSVLDGVSYAKDEEGKFDPALFWSRWGDVGFATSYGVGFGYPWLSAAAQPTPGVGCSVEDYVRILQNYNLVNGPYSLIKKYGEDWKEAVSIIEEAEQVLNARFKCLDPEKNLESLRAKEAIKLLMLAMNIRVGVERQLYE